MESEAILGYRDPVSGKKKRGMCVFFEVFGDNGHHQEVL